MVDRTNRFSNGQSRRSFLAAAGVGTTAAFAGCLDASLGNGGDDSDLVLVTAESGTGSYTASQGIASTVDNNADEIGLSAEPSSGTEDNIGRLDRGEADIAMLQNRSADAAVADEEPFDDLDFDVQQVVNYHDLPWLFVTYHEWTSIEDIESGSRISPTPGDSGTSRTLTDALEYVLDEDDYDRNSIAYDEQSGSFEEGQLDVGVVTISNFDFEASWVEEMKSNSDTYVLEWPDEIAEELEADDSIPTGTIDMTTDELDGYAHAPDEALAINIPYNFVVRDDLEYDYVYEFLETLHEYREEMEDDHPYLSYYMDDEWWTTRMYDDMPFHPAAADFYEELGVWDDDFVRGD
ncbi:TAXI family TRAP transporter solute-binding subunit [Natronolimnohabitans innermongolicus]|uniref:TRAP transporter solute receptor, TAXI family protein n=1 Tax=Natronolimnohabitans innermongolicus JCM 12255 TaxID=1227499 RepID=L9XDI3_9EURY|nr:TAXI family TRAP transporter solute-binding subunit [Natronolimnohabitans innermongolicus]ELY58683.1 TRAP transporter solute receptor, TAXI family protein [Natronolimnohabitans innermongolicus JCM 12255]